MLFGTSSSVDCFISFESFGLVRRVAPRYLHNFNIFRELTVSSPLGPFYSYNVVIVSDFNTGRQHDNFVPIRDMFIFSC